MHKGFLLIQTLVGIAILALLLGISFYAFSNQKRIVSVSRDADVTLSYLQKARSQTLASVDNSSFGVKFSTSSISLFEGTTYTLAATKSTYAIGSGVGLTTSLSGGATQVYFERLSGEPSATGTIQVKATVGTSSQTIIIRATGLSEIQ